MKKKNLYLIAMLCLSCPALLPSLLYANDWYVRLSVEAPDDPPPIRLDDSNVFGRLHDSVDGLDSHDLAEMPPPVRLNGGQLSQSALSPS